MKRDRFTKEEAEAKVGKKIRANLGFSAVPKGTVGEVHRIDNMGDGLVGEWDVVIRWELPNQRKPLDDWFTKGEYEQYLEEI